MAPTKRSKSGANSRMRSALRDTDSAVKRVPLRTQVIELLRKEVTRTAPGTRLDTEPQLAQRLGVSLLTVREALGALAHEGMILRQQGRGTFVADRSLIPPVSQVAAVIAVYVEIDIGHARASPYFVQVAQHLRAALAASETPNRLYVGFTPPHGAEPAEPTCREFLDDVQRGAISAVCFIGCPSWPHLMAELKTRGIVLMSDHHPEAVIVAPDSEGRVGTAVNHLVANGRRRLACLSHERTPQGRDANRFREILAARGLTVEDRHIMTGRDPLDPTAGAEQIRALWSVPGPHPDGLFIDDDFLVPSAARALAELGIAIPDELRVVVHAHAQSTWSLPVPRGDYLLARNGSRRWPRCPTGSSARSASESLTGTDPAPEAPIWTIIAGPVITADVRGTVEHLVPARQRLHATINAADVHAPGTRMRQFGIRRIGRKLVVAVGNPIFPRSPFLDVDPIRID
jgi:GntR family transcriptional regulator, arabinose operon transcriptional repressor